MGDDKYGSALHELVHSFFDQRLGSGVNGGCCLVKNQHRRIGNGGTGNREKLALALGEVGSVGGQHRVVAVRQTADEGIRIRNFGRTFNFFLRGIEFSKTDIFCYGSREQMGILQNDTEGVAQSVFFDIFYVNAVVDNRTALDVVETVDQVRDRRFSGSCGTDKSNFLAWFGIQADVL